MNLKFGEKYWALVGIIGALILVLIVVRFGAPTGLFLGAGEPQGIGNPLAENKISFYCNYQNYYCMKANELAEKISQSNLNVFFEFKHYPVEGKPYDYKAAIASACAANQGLFSEMHGLLLENHYKLSEDKIFELAETIPGINTAEFKRCVNNEETSQAVFADIVDAQSSGITSVPGFAFEGKKATGNNMQIVEDEITQWLQGNA